jgi:hypothetical protein
MEEFNGKDGLTLARWAFWKKKFGEWSGRIDLPPSVKMHVLATMQVMDGIDSVSCKL